MNLPSSWIAALPSRLGPGERGDDALGEGDLRLARGEDAVDDRDLVRVDAHLALEAEPSAVRAEASSPSRSARSTHTVSSGASIPAAREAVTILARA